MFEIFKLSKREKTRYFIVSGILFFSLGWLFYKNLIASLIMPVFSILFYKKYKMYIVSRKKEIINMEFKDVLYAFSDTAAAGKQADSAILSASRNLKRIYGDKNILTKEFTSMMIRMKEMNEAPEKLLMEFAESCDVEDIRNFIEIYCICIKAGGDKEKAISKAAGIIGEKISLRQELRNILIQKKLEAAILCCITPAVLLFLQITSGEYAEILYVTAAGRIIMSLCMGAACWAALMCLKIMDVKI